MDSFRNNELKLAYGDNSGEWITSQWAKCGAFWFEDHEYVTTLKIAPLFFFSKARKEWVYINLYHKDSGSLLFIGAKILSEDWQMMSSN